jgi:hypothetical protein
MRARSRPTALALCLLLPLLGCGGTRVYRPSEAWSVAPDAPMQVSDEAIARAFDARPQLPDRVHVAYFGFDPGSTQALGDLIRELPGVASVVPLTSLLVTGQRRFEPAPVPGRLDLRLLRLLAARAQCDVLIVVDQGYRVTQEANGWAALAPLLVPMLFTPHLDTEVESFLEAYVLDVRNGYLYGQVTSEEAARVEKETVWSDVAERLAEAQRQALLEQAREALAAVLDR